MAQQKQAIFITGAGSGIGLACVKRFIDQDFFVYGSVINAQELQLLSQQFSHDFMPIVMDLTQEQAVQEAFDFVKRHLNDMKFRALINIAGVIYNGPLMDVTQQQFEHILAVNTIAVHMMTKAFLPLLETHDKLRNKVINISSQSGLRTLPFTEVYSASKFALEALSKAMRHEYSILGLDTCLIEPGQIQTPMAKKILENVQVTPSHPRYIEPMRLSLNGLKTHFL
ncbi:MAG: SDR family NAD(P)-dependent oxidoreductase [Acinetobacter sp.]